MGDVERVCVLISDDTKRPNIILQHLIEKTVGRNRESQIRDPCVSKIQLRLLTDVDEKTLLVGHVGQHPASTSSGGILENGEVQILEENAKLYVLGESIGYTVLFTNQPVDSSMVQRNGCLESSASTSTSASSRSSISRKRKSNDQNDDVDGIEDDDEDARCRTIRQQLSSLQYDSGIDAGPYSSFDVPFTNLRIKAGWETHSDMRLIIYTPENIVHSAKIAGFDMDGTLICTKSGKVFPVNDDDWRILYPEIPKKLHQLQRDGFKIVIITNQRGLAHGGHDGFKRKLKSICDKLKITAQVFITFGLGYYRKPAPGIWRILDHAANGDIRINRKNSIFVGDAAGRPAGWISGKKKDHSCCDRLFALNYEIPFQTPEEFFLGKKAVKFEMPAFDPRAIVAKNDAPLGKVVHSHDVSRIGSFLGTPDELRGIKLPEIIVLVGFPASGKSHFARRVLGAIGYSHINRDTLGSWQKCVQGATDAVKRGHSVVIDNTNPDRESRKRYVALAKQLGVSCRCFHFECSLEQAQHNNTFREIKLFDKKHNSVTDMVLYSFRKKFEEPALSEGFSEIVSVTFRPDFESENDRQLYTSFLRD